MCDALESISASIGSFRYGGNVETEMQAMLDFYEYMRHMKETERSESDILNCINNMWEKRSEMRIETRPKTIS